MASVQETFLIKTGKLVFQKASYPFFLSVLDNAFQHWRRNRLFPFCDLFTCGSFSQAEALTENHNLCCANFCKCLKFQSLMKRVFPSFLHLPPRSQLEDSLDLDPFEKKCLSVLYFDTGFKSGNLEGKTKSLWVWCFQGKHGSTALLVNTPPRYGYHKSLTQIKVLHRLHYSSNKLTKNWCGNSSTSAVFWCVFYKKVQNSWFQHRHFWQSILKFQAF